MGDEFYAIIKLITGEEIFALITVDEDYDDPVILMQNPIVIKYTNNSYGGMFLKVKPWMELPDDDLFIIKMDKIITLTESKNKNLIKIYNQYIKDSTDDDNFFMTQNSSKKSGEVEVSEKMGYISSVEDAREHLEDIFKLDYKDSKES